MEDFQSSLTGSSPVSRIVKGIYIMSDEIRLILEELLDPEPLSVCAEEGIHCIYCDGEMEYGGPFRSDVFHHTEDCVVTRARRILGESP